MRIILIIPASCEQGPEVDFEAELAVILKRAGRDVPEDAALDYVLGYTAANNVSARRWQKQFGLTQLRSLLRRARGGRLRPHVTTFTNPPADDVP